MSDLNFMDWRSMTPEQKVEAAVRMHGYGSRQHLAAAKKFLKGRTEDPPRKTPEKPIAYDSVERRQAIAAHLEKSGVDKELREVVNIMHLGNGSPPGVAPAERRGSTSDGSRTRGDEERNRGDQGRERD